MEKLKPVLNCFVAWLLVSTGGSVCAQFALVQDKDGYVNVRSSADTKKAPIDRIHEGQAVFCSETEGEWTYVFYGHEVGGYIHSSRLVPLTSFASIPLSRASKESVVFQKDSLRIEIHSAPFIVNEHRIEYKQLPGEHPTIKKIDGRSTWWGTDGYLPKQRYKSVTVGFGATTAQVPASTLVDLFEPGLERANVYYDSVADKLYIAVSNSDGSGSYEVLFVFTHGVYTSRLVLGGA